MSTEEHTASAIVQVLIQQPTVQLAPDSNVAPRIISRSAPTQATARWAARRDAMQEAGWQASLWGAVRITLDSGESLVLRATFESPAEPLGSK